MAVAGRPARVPQLPEGVQMAEVDVQRIVVAVDFEDPSLKAVAFARRLAGAFGAAVTLVHALEHPAAAAAHGTPQAAVEASEDATRSRLESLLQDFGSRSTATVAYGDPASVIVEAAQDASADLIVMGTHGRSGLERLMLGSVATRVVKDPPCAVLIVPTGEE